MDATIQALLKPTKFKQQLERTAKSMRLQWPITNVRYIDAYERHKKNVELRRWSELLSKGKSVLSFADNIFGNCCLYNPSLLKPNRFLTALRM